MLEKLLVFPSLLLVAAASCGGKVVVDLPDTDAGTDVPDCANVCVKIEAACPDKTGTCSDTCDPLEALIASGTCVAEISAYLGCLDQNPSYTCAGTTACQAEEKAFFSCPEAMACPGQPGCSK